MRVLMTADAAGGVWEYCLTLARALSDSAIGFDLAVMGPAPREEQLAAAREIRGLELFAGPYRLEWMDDPWVDVDAAGEWLLSLARERQPALIHLNGYSHAALPFAAPKLVVAHSCVCSWWRAVHREAAPASWDKTLWYPSCV